MSDYQSNITLTDLVARINDASRILITTHAKPDGDAYGSVAALTASLRMHKPDATIEGWLMPPVPAPFKLLQGSPFVKEYSPEAEAAGDLGEPDLILVLDTGAVTQIAPMHPFIAARLDRTIIIDHHLSGDLPAQHRYVDSSAAACCTVIADVLDAVAGISADDLARQLRYEEENSPFISNPIVAESLFVGIASDTGWFRFSNTTARTHRVAARLIQNGVDHADLYARLEQQERPAKLALQIRALRSLKLLANDQVAIMTIRANDFTETGALPEETERFVDIPQAVSTVKMVVLMSENPPTDGESSPIRISFRSKPGPDAVNVAEFAEQFGGGGHARAAGAKVDGTIDDVSAAIQAAVLQTFQA